MADMGVAILKLLTAKPFQRSPRPKVTMEKLVSALQRMGNADANGENVASGLQIMKGRGYANTSPKIIMANELATLEFEVWITPLGRDNLPTLAGAQA